MMIKKLKQPIITANEQDESPPGAEKDGIEPADDFSPGLLRNSSSVCLSDYNIH